MIWRNCAGWGNEVQAVLAGIRGVSEASVEQLTGQTFLQVRVDSQAIARYRRANAQRVKRRRSRRVSTGGRRARRTAALPAGGAAAGQAAHRS